jgi:hypothetical protein
MEPSLPMKPPPNQKSSSTRRKTGVSGLKPSYCGIEMLHILQQLPPTENTVHRLIEANDAQIDRLVYELFGLTEKENRIVGAGES